MIKNLKTKIRQVLKSYGVRVVRFCKMKDLNGTYCPARQSVTLNSDQPDELLISSAMHELAHHVDNRNGRFDAVKDAPNRIERDRIWLETMPAAEKSADRHGKRLTRKHFPGVAYIPGYRNDMERYAVQRNYAAKCLSQMKSCGATPENLERGAMYLTVIRKSERKFMSSTKAESYQKIKPTAATKRALILKTLKAAGNRGMTRTEIAAKSQLRLSTVCGQCCPMITEGQVRVIGKIVDPESGRTVEVLKAA